MERRLKERLTGAVVLIALVIIFLPMILDETVLQETRITETNIPPKPAPAQGSRIIPLDEPVSIKRPVTALQQTEEATIADKSGEAGLEEPASSEKTVGRSESQPDEPPATAPDKKTEPSVDKTAQGVAEDSRGLTAWVVQLGSFSSQDNADSLVRQLRTEGYPAYVEEISVEEGIRHRVRVGPELLRADAERLLDTLNDKYDLNGILLAYP